MPTQQKESLYLHGSQLVFTILVSALGYFVDIYDLILFSIVRLESLASIGVHGDQLISASELILNSQMAGMLIGGVIFGVLADKRGRLSVLMASILLYSLMNIANAFVTNVPMYAVFRFFAGIGLAGELGVAITLVTEVMRKETRGYGTTIVASMGILGAVAAYFVHALFNWQAAFIAGGVMGLGLLAMRVRLHESGMFAKQAMAPIAKGNLLMLFNRGRLLTYLACIAIGIPVWYVVGVLVTFSPELASASGTVETVVTGLSITWTYMGMVVGDLASGLLSQWLRSRKKVILLHMILTVLSVWWFLTDTNRSPETIYLQCGILGYAIGYWAVFVTTAAEQFGTNLRATVATTVPNFVRGGMVPILFLLHLLRTGSIPGSDTQVLTGGSIIQSAGIIAVAVFAVALGGWVLLRETFHKDLDYVEN